MEGGYGEGARGREEQIDIWGHSAGSHTVITGAAHIKHINDRTRGGRNGHQQANRHQRSNVQPAVGGYAQTHTDRQTYRDGGKERGKVGWGGGRGVGLIV